MVEVFMENLLGGLFGFIVGVAVGFIMIVNSFDYRWEKEAISQGCAIYKENKFVWVNELEKQDDNK